MPNLCVGVTDEPLPVDAAGTIHVLLRAIREPRVASGPFTPFPTGGYVQRLTAESLRELRAEKDAEIAELTARLKKLEALVATLAGQHNATDK